VYKYSSPFAVPLFTFQKAFLHSLVTKQSVKSSKSTLALRLALQQPSRYIGYKDFGHRPTPTPFVSVCWYAFLVGGIFTVLFVDLERYFPVPNPTGTVDAASISEKDKEEVKSDNLDVAVEENGDFDNKKKRIGFRDRKIIEYENRMRQYSTPDKVFRYFATYQLSGPNDEVFMTPLDFLRSITPGMKQPEGLGLDQFKRFDPKSVEKEVSSKLREELGLEENSIFLKLGSSGLISFSDYIFLLTLLSTSVRHFEIAFRMFDLNGDGDVDAEEFDQVAELLRMTTSVGSRHRDHGTTGNTFKGVNSALSAYFFGPNRDQKLTIEKFVEFQHQLQREILTLEFCRKGLREDETLSEVDFADLLLCYAGYSAKKKRMMIKRVRKEYKDNSPGIHLKDYLDFFHFLNNINDVDTALTFYNIAGASIEPSTLKHVAKTVAHVDLNDHVIETVFTIFDENQDGQLSKHEFIAVMKDRMKRGLEKPKDTGFIKFIHSAVKCAKQTRPTLLDF